jgi:hypothetical protein
VRVVASHDDLDDADAFPFCRGGAVEEPSRRRIGLEWSDDDVDARQGRRHAVPRRLVGGVDRHAALARVVHVVPVAAAAAQHVAGDVLDTDDGGAELGEVGTGQRRRLVAEVEHDDVIQQPHRADVM